jgi:hypothetical protein
MNEQNRKLNRIWSHCALLVFSSSAFGCLSGPDESVASHAEELRTPHWSGLIGGRAGDWVSSIATDPSSADIAAVGTFLSQADVDPGPAMFNVTSHGDSDAFVARYTANGALRWAFALGGAGTDEGNSVAIAPSGDVFVTGYFSRSVDFDPGPGVFSLTASGTADEAFIAQYDSLGHFVWADHLHTSMVSDGTAIAVGADGNFAWGGAFSGTISGPLQGTTPRTALGIFDAFVALYDGSHHLKFFRALGSAGSDNYTRGVAVEPDGSVAAAGELNRSVTLAPGITITPAGGYDGFLTRLTTSGNYVFAEALGGPLDDVAHGVSIDAQGNLVVAAEFQGTARFPVPSGVSRSSAGSSDALIGSFNATTGAALWVDAFGSTGPDAVVAVSARGQLLTAAGYFSRTVDFDPSSAFFNLTTSGSDMFALQMTSSGNFRYAIASSPVSAGAGSAARSVSLDVTGSSVIAGAISGTELIAPNTLTTSGTDGFIVRRRP